MGHAMTDIAQMNGRRGVDPLWLYAGLGSAFSALAIISLAQKALSIGLAPTMHEVLQYYRAAVHPIMEFLLGWVRFFVPNWVIPNELKDLYAMSFVGGATLGRAFAASRAMEGATPLVRATMGVIVGLTTSIAFIGLAAIAASYVIFVVRFFVIGTADAIAGIFDALTGRAFYSETRGRRAQEIAPTFMFWAGMSAFGWPYFGLVDVFMTRSDGVVFAFYFMGSVGIFVSAVLWIRRLLSSSPTLVDWFQGLLPLSVLGAILFFAVNSQM